MAWLPFDANVFTLVREGDPETSREAAASVLPLRTELQRRIYTAFMQYGPMTDAELLELPEFRGYGPSTLRTRRSELHRAGRLQVVGSRQNRASRRMLLWAAVRE
jgi:hypothetical protein